MKSVRFAIVFFLLSAVSTFAQINDTYVIPVAFIITIPAQALSGRTGHMPLFVACLVGILSLTASSLFWKHGLKSYTGASS